MGRRLTSGRRRPAAETGRLTAHTTRLTVVEEEADWLRATPRPTARPAARPGRLTDQTGWLTGRRDGYGARSTLTSANYLTGAVHWCLRTVNQHWGRSGHCGRRGDGEVKGREEESER
jgi:hypothetical protein